MLIDELHARKTEALAKTQRKADDIDITLARKERLIAEHRAEIAKLEDALDLKRSQQQEHLDYVALQQGHLDQIEELRAEWHRVDEELSQMHERKMEFSDMVRVTPSMKRDGTELYGMTYDQMGDALDGLYKRKVAIEEEAKAVFYGKR